MSLFAVPLALNAAFWRAWGMGAERQVQMWTAWGALARQISPAYPAAKPVPTRATPAPRPQRRAAKVTPLSNSVAKPAAKPATPPASASAPRRRARKTPATPVQPFKD